MQEVWVAFGLKEASLFLEVLSKSSIITQIKEERATWTTHLNLATENKLTRLCVPGSEAGNARITIEEFLNSDEGFAQIRENLFGVSVDDELIHSMLFNSLEGTTNSYFKELVSRGWDESKIEARKQEIIESLYIKDRASDLIFFIGFMGVLAGGLIGLTVGLLLFFGEKKHPVTKRGFGKYDALTDKYAKWMMAIGGLVFFSFLIHYLWVN